MPTQKERIKEIKAEIKAIKNSKTYSEQEKQFMIQELEEELENVNREH